MPEDLAQSCANNFTEIGALDILNFIKTNLTKEAALVSNIKGVSKNTKGFTDLMIQIITLDLLPLLNDSMVKHPFTLKHL